VERILILGNKAKVWTNETRRELTGREKGTESSRSWETFWILEEGDWRASFGREQYDFDDLRAIEVPIEEETPR